MGMYKGPYVFEFIGATMRWGFLILFFPKHKNEKGLFKKILVGNSTLGSRSWETFFLNFFGKWGRSHRMSDSKPDLAGELPACDKSVRPDIGRSAFQHFPIDRAPAWIAVCVDETVPVA